MAAFDSDNSELLDVLPTGDNARQFLTSNYWTIGLQNRFILFLKKISIRYFVCDDSGSVRLLIEIMRIGYLVALLYLINCAFRCSVQMEIEPKLSLMAK